jgi:uncharacterized protein YfiM (DUF2279 family)
MADTANRAKPGCIIAGSAVVLAAGTILLNEAWYKKYDRSSFHLYNDLDEWLQMDKAGHLFSSYSLSLSGIQLMRQTGLDDRKAIWYGGLYGPVFLSAIEVLDGFCRKWGFSLADMAANIAGSGFAVTQELVYGRQIGQIKYSYSGSGLARYRPEILGRNLPEKMLKDYNGQTYWLSFNLKAAGLPRVPGWLNISAGYSANGMLGGASNPGFVNDMEMPYLERHRQFFLAPDIDFSAIQTRSETIRVILRALNLVKFPSPALEYNTVDGLKLHLLYF